MYDLVSIGSLTIDQYFQGDTLTVKNNRFELAYGGKYFTEFFYESLGGGATNVAIGVRRHGLDVTLKTTISDNAFRPIIEDKLRQERVSYIHSHFEKNYFDVSCILLSKKGEKTVINYRTPHQNIFSNEKEKQGVLRAKAVYMGNLPDVSFTQKVEAIKLFKSHDKPIFVNLGAEDCRRSREQIHEFLQYADILIVNAHEFADLIKTPYEKVNFKQNMFTSLALPNLKAVIVTEDKKGSHGYAESGSFYQAAIEPPRIVDSTGAGDGYSAGFIASYLEHHDISQAMHSGSSYAAKILAKIGAN